MNVAVLFPKFYRIEIRRLLVIMGMVVAVVVVFQFMALPFGTILSLSPVISNNINASDLEEQAWYENEVKRTETGYASASNDDRNQDSAFDTYVDRNLHNEFIFEKGVITATYDKSLAIENVRSKENGSLKKVEITNTNSKLHDDLNAYTNLKVEEARNPVGFASLPLMLSPVISTNGMGNLNADSRVSIMLVAGTLNNNSTLSSNHKTGRRVMQPTSISQMNSLLVQNVVSSSLTRPQQSSACDRELLSAKLQIENAPILRNTPGLYASVFRNVSMFRRSYELMERVLKVYVYREGEKPIFHQPRLNGIYASEGWFMKLIEGNKQFVVRDPRKAHLFYLPFSLKMLRTAFDQQNSHGWRGLTKYLDDYVDMIAEKYRFWNRTGGADHFLVACHDWALAITKDRMQNCIRVVCNANVARGFNIRKDATLPVTYVRKMDDPLRDLGGKPPSERPILAFFAGSMHGYIRPILLQYWENKEPDMKIFGPMPLNSQGRKQYREHMKSSKYCICARGYEVHTPRVVEAIFSECVPVIISDNYVPPFFEVFDWEAFAVFVQERDIPNLRNILLSIPEKKYLAMHLRVKMVQHHFLWHKKPEKYDLFHMILHSVWYNRVFQIQPR